ncbi:hypothetical protein [Cecembia lonarensis]|nr:hypothetical protein [Cecembia lonarensis]
MLLKHADFVLFLSFPSAAEEGVPVVFLLISFWSIAAFMAAWKDFVL